MTVLTVVLALLAALGNAAASVLQRRGTTQVDGGGAAVARWWSWATRLLRRRVWLWGAALLAVSGLCQAAALAAGPLAVVQPVMTTELLFTMVIGSAVFRRRPDVRTWWAFVAMAAGLGAFMALLSPTGGGSTVPGSRWLWSGVLLAVLMVVLTLVAWRLPPAPAAAVLGTATAIGFAGTAALVKDALGRLPDGGLGALATTWQAYAAVVVGLGSFLLLQLTLRAGPLVASQPAMTLGDAFLSMLLGRVLFGEDLTFGVRLVPELLALALLIAGTVQLARSPLLTSTDGKERPW
ncbi:MULTISPECIES: DMT family transporter [Streptomyces]|uniref:Membrane protein n=1 Tax=Streptomyces wadayamensis TaxID=141454 RepID=A0ABR4SE38_9ACTN|nr:MULTISPECIES: DMT family transporter [Streptomyces]KDR63931.1 membrane protein [Streptomyces wadayamensis]QXQ28563.1 DMT family transporter [Streptomyces albidoflavus]QXQ34487.1 DMT family transporter [Streptomyces albidoflavus]WTB61390.1 DMT family transporter [Streptomyces albidoflavus]